MVQRPGDVSRAVVAVVVDQDDPELTWIVLRQQAADRASDDVGLIASRHDGDHRGPDGRRRGLVAIIPLGRQPEAAPPYQQIKPGAERRGRDERGPDHLRYPAAPNQRSASLAKPSETIGPRLIAQFALRLGGGEEHMMGGHVEGVAGDEGLLAGDRGDRLGGEGQGIERCAGKG